MEIRWVCGSPPASTKYLEIHFFLCLQNSLIQFHSASCGPHTISHLPVHDNEMLKAHKEGRACVCVHVYVRVHTHLGDKPGHLQAPS